MRVVRESTNEPAVQAAGLDALGNLSRSRQQVAWCALRATHALRVRAGRGGGGRRPASRLARMSAHLATNGLRTTANVSSLASPPRRLSRKTREVQETKPRSRNEKKKHGVVVAPTSTRSLPTRAARRHVLARTQLVRRATGRRQVSSRGVRVLCMDGGGIRGVSTIRMLRRPRGASGCTGLFDLICGTSTGGSLRWPLACDNHLTTCGARDLPRLGRADAHGRAVRRATQQGRTRNKHRVVDRIGNLYTSALQACSRPPRRLWRHLSKHDASLFEDAARLPARSAARLTPADPRGEKENARHRRRRAGRSEGVRGLHARLRAPGDAVPVPQLPVPAGRGGRRAVRSARADQRSRCRGADREFVPGRKHRLWQGVRASSAAPYYLADYQHGEDKWQDGAVTRNNPAMLGVMEARRLWPDRNIDCVE